MIPSIIASKDGVFVVCPKCAHKRKLDPSEHSFDEEWLIICDYCDEPIRFIPNGVFEEKKS